MNAVLEFYEHLSVWYDFGVCDDVLEPRENGLYEEIRSKRLAEGKAVELSKGFGDIECVPTRTIDL